MPSAGYSGTPLAKKLGIKAGSRLLVVNAPERLFDLLESLPEDVEVVTDRAGPADVVLLFADRAAELDRWFASLEPHLASGNRLWVGWPKKASGVATDLSFGAVQRVGLETGLVDTKVCAIDDTWSGVCFMRRRR